MVGSTVVRGALLLAVSLILGAGGVAKADLMTVNGTFSLDAVATGTIYNSFLQTVPANAAVDDHYFFTLDSPPVTALTTAVTLSPLPNGVGLGIKDVFISWFAPGGALMGSLQITDDLGNLI